MQPGLSIINKISVFIHGCLLSLIYSFVMCIMCCCFVARLSHVHRNFATRKRVIQIESTCQNVSKIEWNGISKQSTVKSMHTTHKTDQQQRVYPFFCCCGCCCRLHIFHTSCQFFRSILISFSLLSISVHNCIRSIHLCYSAFYVRSVCGVFCVLNCCINCQFHTKNRPALKIYVILMFFF